MSEIVTRSNFTGKMGFIMATAASAIGLGNLWRFPYVTSQCGGGVFVVVYIILAVTFGLCLMMAEIAIGRKTGKSCLTAFGDMSKKHKWIGVLIALIPMLIVPYYCVIGGWVTKWMGETAVGNLSMLAEDHGSYWWQFVTNDFGGDTIWFLIFACLCLVCILLGVQRGIEKLSKILLPALFIMIIGITVYEFATIDNIWKGVEYYLVPKSADDLNAGTFLGAVGQIFYSMSIAMGILITYGSYMKKDVDIEKSAATVAGMDTGVAILAGLMIIPAAVILAEGQELSGMGLMFTTLPQVFVSMPGGNIIAPIFYLLVMFAAMTSAISLIETITSVFMDEIKKKRVIAVGLSAIIIVIIGMMCILGFKDGPLFFETQIGGKNGVLGFLDSITNNFMMPIAAILVCLFIAFVIKTSFVSDEIKLSSKFRLGVIFDYMIKYVCPAFLILILAVNLLALAGVVIY